MKNKLYLVLALVFLIAVVFDFVEMCKLGISNCSNRFLANFVLNVLGCLCWSMLFVDKNNK